MNNAGLLRWLLGGLLSMATIAAAASDRISYTPEPSLSAERTSDSPSPWIPRPLVTVVGTIQSFDADRIEIVPSGGDEPLRIPSARLLSVDPAWSDDDAKAGVEAYRQGDYQEAIPSLLSAVKRGPAVWQQQWLSVRMAIAAFQAGRYPAVLELIAQLDRSGLPPVMIGQLPIQWHRTTRDPRMVAAAAEKLTAADPLVRLTAASLLLGGARSADAAATLQQLRQDAAHPLLARLADALLWRQTTPTEIKEAFPRWQQKIEQLPIAVRWGPMMTVADRLQAAGQSEQALEWWLAAGLLAPQTDHPAATAAKQRANEILEQLGATEERVPTEE